MHMCIQMILAVLVGAIAFGAVTELQILSIGFRTSADGTFMTGDPHFNRCGRCFFKVLSALNISWRITLPLTEGQEVEKEV